MKAFFDSSAFAKRYIEESGSDRVEALCVGAAEVAVSAICLPELISALCRFRREAILTQTQYEKAKQALLSDLADATVCAITPSVVGQSIRLLEANVLRAMDALHIGCALEWKADLFVSSDRQQISAARKAGLEVVRV